ncbi:iron-sulfur cluster assembly accessory protein [Candida albicans P94015]|nr:iron-sulfur cluster assembly accessory protein [Candida albicans P94015]
MLGTKYFAISKRISTLKSFKPLTLGGTTIITLRYNSTKPSTTTTNSSVNSSRLKPSSFAFPSSPTSQQSSSTTTSTNDSITSSQQQEDINDFRATKLIHGKTNLSFAITERASKKLNEISQQDNQDSGLLIQVESGGCHGFQYNLKLTNIDKELQQQQQQQDGDANGEHDLIVFERDQGGKVIMNESSLMILQDSKLDYTKELIGSQFKIVDSPYTSSACGCGSSFDFDFDKLSQKEG